MERAGGTREVEPSATEVRGDRARLVEPDADSARLARRSPGRGGEGGREHEQGEHGGGEHGAARAPPPRGGGGRAREAETPRQPGGPDCREHEHAREQRIAIARLDRQRDREGDEGRRAGRREQADEPVATVGEPAARHEPRDAGQPGDERQARRGEQLREHARVEVGGHRRRAELDHRERDDRREGGAGEAGAGRQRAGGDEQRRGEQERRQVDLHRHPQRRRREEQVHGASRPDRGEDRHEEEHRGKAVQRRVPEGRVEGSPVVEGERGGDRDGGERARSPADERVEERDPRGAQRDEEDAGGAEAAAERLDEDDEVGEGGAVRHAEHRHGAARAEPQVTGVALHAVAREEEVAGGVRVDVELGLQRWQREQHRERRDERELERARGGRAGRGGHRVQAIASASQPQCKASATPTAWAVAGRRPSASSRESTQPTPTLATSRSGATSGATAPTRSSALGMRRVKAAPSASRATAAAAAGPGRRRASRTTAPASTSRR